VQNLLLFIESQALLHALSRTTQNYECEKCHMSEEGQRYFVRLRKSLTERRLINQRQKIVGSVRRQTLTSWSL